VRHDQGVRADKIALQTPFRVGLSPRRDPIRTSPILNTAQEEGWILQPIGKRHRSVGFKLPRNGGVGQLTLIVR
jgi:hypothetical protein